MNTNTNTPMMRTNVDHRSSANHVSFVRDEIPGAYCVLRRNPNGGQGSGGAAPRIYRVVVPEGVRPRQEFQVQAGGRLVRVTCPRGVSPGQTIQISVAPESAPILVSPRGMAPLTSLSDSTASGGAVPMRPDIQQWNEQHPDNSASIRRNKHNTANGTTNQSSSNAPSHQAYMVTIPSNVRPGEQFAVHIGNSPANSQQQPVYVTCPPNARPGMNVRIHIPTSPQKKKMQMFEVTVPAGVRPNQPFAILAAGQRVLVTCPADAIPGQKIRFQLTLDENENSSSNDQNPLNLNYKNGTNWSRMIRLDDYQFTWVRTLDDNQDETAKAVDTQTRFDRHTSAYCRRIQFLQGNDPRMRTGKLSLIPASHFAVESQVFNDEGMQIVSHTDFTMTSTFTYEQKCKWFYSKCDALKPTWEDGGHVCIKIRRQHLLEDSMNSVMSLGRPDLRKIWRFEFLKEQGKDAGGLAREWFTLITQRLMDADFGLWLSSVTNQACMTINPASEISCPEDHLIYFRFLGRVMGKAVMDQQLVVSHMVPHLYKHLLGFPITFADLENVDADLYSNLCKVEEERELLEHLCLDFTLQEETRLGLVKQVDLIPNGSNIDVTSDNLPEYLEANLKHRMLTRIQPQLTELLLGFYDVLPEPLLLIFDYYEFELLMCGLPKIEIHDWKSNTLYSGLFSSPSNNTCIWFWQIVENEYSKEQMARLLQFVTGTSGVPSRGFSVLQGNDGNIKKFTLHGITASTSIYPRAHTCFNRLDLPIYSTKAELRERLKFSISTSATGFDME